MKPIACIFLIGYTIKLITFMLFGMKGSWGIAYYFLILASLDALLFAKALLSIKNK